MWLGRLRLFVPRGRCDVPESCRSRSGVARCGSRRSGGERPRRLTAVEGERRGELDPCSGCSIVWAALAKGWSVRSWRLPVFGGRFQEIMRRAAGEEAGEPV